MAGNKYIVAIPTRGRVHIVVQARVQQIAQEHNAEFRIVQGEPVTIARNEIALHFMESDATHLLMIDSDTMPLCTDVISRLLSVGTDVATGITPILLHDDLRLNVSRNGEWETEWPSGQFAVSRCGASCMLIARHVFAQIPWPWFVFMQDRNGHLIGEDVMFCEKVLAAGLLIGCDASVVCEHFKEIGLLRLIPPPSEPTAIDLVGVPNG